MLNSQTEQVIGPYIEHNYKFLAVPSVSIRPGNVFPLEAGGSLRDIEMLVVNYLF